MENNHYNTLDLICPFCDYIFLDSAEFAAEERGDAYCPNCSRTFAFVTYAFYTFDSFRKDE